MVASVLYSLVVTIQPSGGDSSVVASALYSPVVAIQPSGDECPI